MTVTLGPFATAALRYARHGWQVFLLRVRGKAPLLSRGRVMADALETLVMRSLQIIRRSTAA